MGWDRVIILRYGLCLEGGCFETMASQLYNLNTNHGDMLLNEELLEGLNIEVVATKGSLPKLWILHKEYVKIAYWHILSYDRCNYSDDNDDYIDEMYDIIMPINKYKFNEEPFDIEYWEKFDSGFILPDGTIEVSSEILELNQKLKNITVDLKSLPLELNQRVLELVNHNKLNYEVKEIIKRLFHSFGWVQNKDYKISGSEQLVIHDYISY